MRAKIKGTGIIGIVKALRSRREAVKQYLSPELDHYLEERIVLNNWYPEQDYLHLLQVYRKVWPERSYEDIGRFGAQEALSGVYRNIVTDDVATSARHMRVNWRNYHDTGELSIDVEPSVIRVKVSDYPVVSDELCRLNQGYFSELLKLGGAQILSCSKVRCTVRGDEDCLWEFDWRKA
jgi:hypothetical protein